jgi:hypothetical protein
MSSSSSSVTSSSSCSSDSDSDSGSFARDLVRKVVDSGSESDTSSGSSGSSHTTSPSPPKDGKLVRDGPVVHALRPFRLMREDTPRESHGRVLPLMLMNQPWECVPALDDLSDSDSHKAVQGEGRVERLLLTNQPWACVPPLDDSDSDLPKALPYNKRARGGKGGKRSGVSDSDSGSSKKRGRGRKGGKRSKRVRAISVSSSSSDSETVREPVKVKLVKSCTKCRQPGHTRKNCGLNPVCNDPGCKCVQCPEKAKLEAKADAKRAKVIRDKLKKEQEAKDRAYIEELKQKAARRAARKAAKRLQSSCRTDSSSGDSEEEPNYKKAARKKSKTVTE